MSHYLLILVLQKNSGLFSTNLWNNIIFTPDQLFNCDETGLYWWLLPNKTLVDASEKCANIFFKSPKDRVTLMATANASRDFQLTLVFIYKSAKPHVIENIKCD